MRASTRGVTIMMLTTLFSPEGIALVLSIVNSLLLIWRFYTVPAKGSENVKGRRKGPDPRPETEDLLSDLPSGDFASIPQQLEPAIGALCAVVLSGGGYIGFSTTDDGGSAKLTIRTAKHYVDRRFYKLADLEAAIATVFSRVRNGT